MKHEPMTESQIEALGLLQPGIYDFTIAEAEEQKSKKGNDMFKLILHVFEENGKPRKIYDWVMPSFPKKYKHLHDALGILDIYAKGETTTDDLKGKSGKLSLGIGEPRTDNNGIERVNNTVIDYVKKDNVDSYGAKNLDDDIPF